VSLDPRTPVIIGVGQVSRSAPDLSSPADPISLMSEATRAAVADAGAPRLASQVDLVGVVGGAFSYSDPGRLVADNLGFGSVGSDSVGSTNLATVLTTWGGHTPIAFLGDLAERIRTARIDVAVMVGGENNATRRAVRAAGGTVPRWTEAEGAEAEPWGAPLDMGDTIDAARGGELPRNNYAILDSAIRARREESLDQARDRAARLWAGFASVAAGNPHAADRSAMTAEEIREPSPANRMVSWPYTKAMCANNQVDQAGAVVIASVAAADRLGVPTDRRVYPHDLVIATDTDSLLHRAELHHVPALAEAGVRIRNTWGDIDAMAHLDLYGCFPSIVAHTCELFGISTDRQLTVTGGLGFMGAPLNFAAGQSLIAMVQTLRADDGAYGMVQGNGGHAAKHAFGVYSTTPPTTVHSSSPIIRGPAAARAEPDRVGEPIIDGVTVEYSHAGPERAVAVCRFDDGARTWANSTDTSVMEAFVSRECVGRRAEVSGGSIRL